MKEKTQKKDNKIDYAAVADVYADAADESGESSVEDEENVSGNDSATDDESKHDSGTENESGAEEEGGLSDDDAENAEEQAEISKKVIPLKSAAGEQCTFDLRNLLAVNAHQISTAELYSSKAKRKDGNITISPQSAYATVNEDYLLKKAVDGCTQLIYALWQLPVERSDAGPMVVLPAFDESRIPRALVCYSYYFLS